MIAISSALGGQADMPAGEISSDLRQRTLQHRRGRQCYLLPLSPARWKRLPVPLKACRVQPWNAKVRTGWW